MWLQSPHRKDLRCNFNLFIENGQHGPRANHERKCTCEHQGQNKSATRDVIVCYFESANKCQEGCTFLKTKVYTKGIQGAKRYKDFMKWKHFFDDMFTRTTISDIAKIKTMSLNDIRRIKMCLEVNWMKHGEWNLEVQNSFKTQTTQRKLEF